MIVFEILGTTSRFAHLENFSLNFSSYLFPLDHPRFFMIYYHHFGVFLPNAPLMPEKKSRFLGSIHWFLVAVSFTPRLRVVSLSLSPLCMTRKETSWPRKLLGRQARERRVPPFVRVSPQDFTRTIFFSRGFLLRHARRTKRKMVYS